MGIFDSPFGIGLHSAMALDEDDEDNHVVDPGKSDVIRPKKGVAESSCSDEDDPWA